MISYLTYMTKRTSVIIPNGLLAKVRAIAGIEDKLPSEVIRDAIRFYLEECEDYEDIDWSELLDEVPEDEDVEVPEEIPTDEEQAEDVDEDAEDEIPPPPDD